MFNQLSFVLFLSILSYFDLGLPGKRRTLVMHVRTHKHVLLSLIPLSSRGFCSLPGAHCPGLCMSAEKYSVRIACGSHLDYFYSTKIKI